MKLGLKAQLRPAMSGPLRTTCYWLSVCLLALATALILEGALHLNLLIGWLISINLFTFLYYGIDKLNSIWEDVSPKNKAQKTRIPEHSLLLMALAGGTPGALLGMLICNHKTDDAWFAFRVLIMLAAHMVAGYWIWSRMHG